MNITCPHCETVFRVDPQKVPAGGVRTRCSVCRGVFEVLPDAADRPEPAPPAASPERPPSPPPAAAPPATTPPAPPPPAPPPPRNIFSPTPPTSSPPAAPSPPSSSRAPTLPPSPPQKSGAPPGLAPFRFGSADPGAKARRLARALVSDIITYHPERREEALRDGSLKTEFRDEIRKSWEEYVDQVGLETARTTPHFRDALNDILARGQPIF